MLQSLSSQNQIGTCEKLSCPNEEIHAQSKLAEYQKKRRQIETDVAYVLCEDPLRSGQVFTRSNIQVDCLL